MKKILLGLILTLSQFASAQNASPRSVVSLMTDQSSIHNFMNFVNPSGGCAGISLSTENIVYQVQIRSFISSLSIKVGPMVGFYQPTEFISNRINETGQGLIVIGLPLNASASVRVDTKNSESLLSAVQKYFGQDASMSLGYYDECPVDTDTMEINK